MILELVYAPMGPEENQQFFHYLVEALDAQEESYNRFWTKEEILSMVEQGIMNPWYYIDKDQNLIGVVLYSVQRYSEKKRSLKIEFMTCKNFFSMTKLLNIFEARATQAGFFLIEAIAHPTIGEYACRKHGFEVEGILISKQLTKGRLH